MSDRLTGEAEVPCRIEVKRIEAIDSGGTCRSEPKRVGETAATACEGPILYLIGENDKTKADFLNRRHQGAPPTSFIGLYTSPLTERKLRPPAAVVAVEVPVASTAKKEGGCLSFLQCSRCPVFGD